jgi:molybdate transport system ATP-binding protein
VRGELAQLLREFDLPTLIVTHDYEDAVTIAARVGVIVDGTLRQLGTPEQLVANPADAFVASFTGAHLLRGKTVARHARLTEVELETGELVHSTDAIDGDVNVVVHPWDITLTPNQASPDPASNEIRGRVTSVVRLGGSVRVRFGALTAELPTAAVDEHELAIGATMRARFSPAQTRLIGR